MSSPSTPRRSSRINASPAAQQQSPTDPRAATAVALGSDDIDVMSSPLRYPSSPVFATPRSSGGRGKGSRASQLQDRSMSSQAEISSPLHYPTSSSPPRAPSTTTGNLTIKQNIPSSSQSGIFVQPRAGTPGTNRNPVTPRHRRGDIHSSQPIPNTESGPGVAPQSLLSFDQSDDPAATVRVIWGTTVNIQEAMTTFKQFVLGFKLQYRKREEGQAITDADTETFYPKLLNQIKETETYNINLDCRNLMVYKPTQKLYHQLVRYPQEIIPLMDHTLTEIFLDLFDDVDLNGQSLKVRPFNLQRAVNMRDLDPSDIDQLVTVKGLLIRVSSVIPDMKQAFFRCLTCDYTMTVSIDRGRIDEPTRCPRQQCGSQNTMSLIHNRSEFSDKQICRLQETPDAVPDGQTPQTVSLCMYDDLVDVAKPGDRLEITGIFRSVPVRINPNQRTLKSLYRTYLDVVHVKRSDKKRLAIDNSIVGTNEAVISYDEGDEIQTINSDEEAQILELAKKPDIYDILARSLAPSIYELDDVKKGILLQLFGGTNKNFTKSGAPRYRGDINVLLVGDPGTSKSQILQYVHKIAPRGVFTSGKGSSAVGLTVYITRDPDTRQLVLESGALVLSDGGVCCIDEFDKMSEATRSVLHEVMEQQTVSVAKAGIITTLNARTSILACANPIDSRWNPDLSVPQNLDLPPTLLSRFDLLYLILDRVDEASDRRLARFLLSLYLEDAPTTAGYNIVAVETLTRYITYARNKIQPVISEDAARRLIDCYVELRKVGEERGTERRITATTRQLESMIRMSEAHARLRLSKTVEVEDVNEASRLLREAIQESATDPVTGKIDMDLINTGTGSHGRHVKLDLMRELISKLLSYESNNISWTTLFNDFNEQSTVPISFKVFEDALDELEVQGNIKVTGDGRKKLIRRLVTRNDPGVGF